MQKILIANRGEIAVRIAQAISELDLQSVAVFSQDDADQLHPRMADQSVALTGRGAAAYLDIAGLVSAAKKSGCDAIHPGYGFLSESAEFSAATNAADLTFIGASPEILNTLGHKTRALALATSLDIPVIAGLPAGAIEADIRAVLRDCPTGAILKAVGGGGGRGMRIVTDPQLLTETLATVQAEAKAAFGDARIYVEQYIPDARHIEVQVIGDGTSVAHLWDRDCSLQRRHQKIIEIAPAPALDKTLRDQLLDAACKMAKSVGLRGLATFEFLLSTDGNVAFIEANPRLQVEHTITEAISGVDLVQTQIMLAQGATLPDLGLTQDKIAPPIGAAVQLRINCERMAADGVVLPTGGTLTTYSPPGGPGVRLDSAGFAGLTPNPAFDSLLAKLIVHAPAGHVAAIKKAKRALRDFTLGGIDTNMPVLAALLELPGLADGLANTHSIADNLGCLVAAQDVADAATPTAAPQEPAHQSPPQIDGAMLAPMPGTVLSVDWAPGDTVAKGTRLMTLEAMKMQHAIKAPFAAKITRIAVSASDTIMQGDLLAVLEPISASRVETAAQEEIDPETIRPDLAELKTRQALTADQARPHAVAKRHKQGKRMARENIADLCDLDSFVEYGDLVFAAQRSRRSVDDLMQNTPADGLVTGFGSVNSDKFPTESTRCGIMAYDYTVLAGTQGVMNHEKKDRMLDVIRRQKTPLIFFCEGGGGRPGDVDAMDTTIAGLHLTTFWHHAQLSGLVPVVGIGSGRVFAGNAALLGCCDVVIATRDANIGMGGPAMIEGGGLGVFKPEDVGPSDVQTANGVIDILVEDEAEAVTCARKYVGFFQGRTSDWTAPDSRTLRHVVPENRLEVYDVHQAINGLADLDSVLELRAGFAPGMVTALARIEGRPIGIIANNSLHLAGAIDSGCADKATRFVQLCDAFDIPIVSLIDTPGMMVGPEVEKTALVRHCSRLFLAAGNASVPMMSVVLRKGYGLGAMVMAAGCFRTPLFTVSWPSGEFGGMGLEGAVRLGYRKELEAITDPTARQALFDKMVAESYARGKALSAASVLEIDAVIDPADTRKWIASTLEAAPPPEVRAGKKRPFIDAW